MPNAAPRPALDPVVVDPMLTAVRRPPTSFAIARWALLILLAAHGGTTRFAESESQCGAASRLLTSRLALLDGQEVRVRWRIRAARRGHLSHIGLALFDVFAAMLR